MMTLPTILFSSASAWKALGVPLANHLWQSTLFTCAAVLLALALKKNRAQARYWVWLSASLKFLIPFSFVTDLGRHLARPGAAAFAQPAFTLVVQQISQPFAPVNATHLAVPAASGLMEIAARILPAAAVVLWFAGCAAVLLTWCGRWRRVRAAMRGAAAADSGRELDAQLRVSQRKKLARPIQLLLSRSTLEPGIVGIFRPVLLLPASISERLTDAQLDAILTHELCHVRRHDNLAAAVHMVVEAIFWFHPLVWWIGARMVDERERACDEDVLRLGNAPQDYAEGILKVCEFYLESPLVCAAGVTGSNLKKRIEDIMRSRVPRKLGFGKKVLLAAFGVAAAIVPVAIGFANPLPGQAQAQSAPAAATADGVSITPHAAGNAMSFMGPVPGGWQFAGVTVKQLIEIAYGLQDFQVSAGPAWLASEKYDVSVKLDSTGAVVPQPIGKGLPPKLMAKLQSFLADQFDLVVHHEARQLPVYAMVVGKDGPKMTEVFLSQPPSGPPNGIEMMRAQANAAGPGGPGPITSPPALMPGTMFVRVDQHDGAGQGQVMAKGVGMDAVANLLSTQIGSEVLNQTGLSGTYEFSLSWSADPQSHTGPGMPQSPAATASLLAAVSQQLGLELKQQTGPVDTLVIDKAEEFTAGDQAVSPAPAN
jgi:bla regulator protein blaR1